MARLRAEKGQSSKKSKSGSKDVKTNLAFGGNKEDAELLKNVDENAITGSVNTDVCLFFYLSHLVSHTL